jgi:hypothetical protein
MVRKKPVDLPPDKAKPDSEPVIIMGESGANLYYPPGKKPGIVRGSLIDWTSERPPRHPRDLFGIIGFPPIDPSLSDAERIGRLWQLCILRIGLYCPAVIAVAVAFLLVAFPSLGLWLGMDPKLITFDEHGGPLGIILDVALSDLLAIYCVRKGSQPAYQRHVAGAAGGAARHRRCSSWAERHSWISVCRGWFRNGDGRRRWSWGWVCGGFFGCWRRMDFGRTRLVVWEHNRENAAPPASN